MTTHTGTATEPQTKDCLLLQPGDGFDEDGHRSTLGELIERKGFYPVDDIISRIPFRTRTLKNWARKGPFTACFKRVHLGPCGNSILLVHLNLLASRFEELAQEAYEGDLRSGLTHGSVLDDVSELYEDAEGLPTKGNP